MTLADFASLSTAISGIAVTASLIYLALQVHQNTKHTRALLHQGRAARVVELHMAQANSDIVEATILAEGGEPSLEAIRALQFRQFCGAYTSSFEESFLQYRNGLLEEDVYQSLRKNVASNFGSAARRANWESRKTPGTAFTRFVDEIISKQALANQPNATTE